MNGLLPIFGIGLAVFYVIGVLWAYDKMTTSDTYKEHHRGEDGGDHVIFFLSFLSWGIVLSM